MKSIFSATVGVIAALLVGRSWQQAQDPLQDFCRRFGHQTAVVDNKLYIDGGLINFNPLSQYPLNYSNTNLLYADLTDNNQNMPQEFNNLSKPATAPDVSGAVLWPDTVNKKLFLYGGEFQGSPQSFSMWSYDAIYNNWTALVPDASQASIQRTSWGAGVAVEERGVGYWYGGWLSNTTVPTWNANPAMMSTFLMYDMVENSWTNSTGPDEIGRAEGIMVYIPASDGGMLLYIGGIQTSEASDYGYVGQPMDEILIYDIANSRWYTQNATGDVPGMRRRFCGGAAWANDYSSYNIYLYGGASMPPLTVGYDDVYILSLPSFQWIKWYPTQPGSATPHHSLTCNVINGNQMLILGGTFPNSSQCDSPNTYGFHNLDLTENNPDDAKWYGFNDSKTGYEVPTEIIAAVGGGPTGGATMRTPSDGFDNPDLSVLFTRVYTAASTRTPTRAIPTSTSTSSGSSHKLSTGAIVGIAVGGGVFVILLCTALVCLCLRRGRSKPALGSPGKPSELPGSGSFTPSPNTMASNLNSPGHPNYAGGYDPNYPYGYSSHGTSPNNAYIGQTVVHQLPAGEGQYLAPVPVALPIELSAGSKTPATTTLSTTGSDKIDPNTGSYSYQHHTPSTSGVSAIRHSTSPPPQGFFHQNTSIHQPQAVYVEGGQQQHVYYPPPQGSGTRSPDSELYGASPLSQSYE